MAEHHYPGEFVFDGAVYDGLNYRAEDLKYIRDKYEFDAQDTVVATYPKAGTTWMQEIVWLVHHGPGSAGRREQCFDVLFPYMEMFNSGKVGYEIARLLPKPRLLKTHFHAKYYKRQLEGSSTCPRFIVVMRNPKELIVSYYHFHKMGKDYFQGNWEDFFDLVKNDRVLYGDYLEHAASWWQYRELPNVLIVRYEDMKEEPLQVIKLVANFLKIRRSDEEIDAIKLESSFTEMKARGTEKYSSLLQDFNNDSQSDFFRSGKTGSWRELFDTEKSAWIDAKTSAVHEKCGLAFREQ